MTGPGFFELLRELGPLRVISQCGPSTFEALCNVNEFGVARGFLNAITPEYHWHLRLNGLRHIRSRDEVHARSGRRVLFFELREQEGEQPFLSIYLYRHPGEEFEPERVKAFGLAHRQLGAGAKVASIA